MEIPVLVERPVVLVAACVGVGRPVALVSRGRPKHRSFSVVLVVVLADRRMVLVGVRVDGLLAVRVALLRMVAAAAAQHRLVQAVQVVMQV